MALKPTVATDDAFQAAAKVPGCRYASDRSLLFQGDVREVLKNLSASGLQVDCIVTSPPYYGQRDYGIEGQLGHEAHPREFIETLRQVFDLCRPLLSDTGSLWVNLGDTYWSGKGAHKSHETKQSARRFGLRPQDLPGDGRWTRPKQQLLIPHRLAIALQDDGWLVRNDNVWIKPSPVPDQVRDRCSVSHEYVFHFVKSRWYYFDREVVGRPQSSGKVLPPLDTWSVRTAAGRGRHRASFSEELVRIPIMGTTPKNGVVLDPFNGSGTSTAFAAKNGFRSIGIDLSHEYTELAMARLAAAERSNPIV